MSRSLAKLTCEYLAVAVFKSYPNFFLVIFLTASTGSSNFSSFSLVNIAFRFSLCELDARLNVSAVTLLETVIDTSSSFIMTLKTASQIFTLDNGVLLL